MFTTTMIHCTLDLIQVVTEGETVGHIMTSIDELSFLNLL